MKNDNSDYDINYDAIGLDYDVDYDDVVMWINNKMENIIFDQTNMKIRKLILIQRKSSRLVIVHFYVVYLCFRVDLFIFSCGFIYIYVALYYLVWF